jgi:hypothetical protein
MVQNHGPLGDVIQRGEAGIPGNRAEQQLRGTKTLAAAPSRTGTARELEVPLGWVAVYPLKSPCGATQSFKTG